MPAQAESAAVWQVNGWQTCMADGAWPQQLVDALGHHGAQEDTPQEVEK